MIGGSKCGSKGGSRDGCKYCSMGGSIAWLASHLASGAAGSEEFESCLARTRWPISRSIAQSGRQPWLTIPGCLKSRQGGFAVSLKVGTSLQELNPGPLSLASHATPAHLALVFGWHTPLHCTPTPCLGAGMEELPSGARGVRSHRGGCSSTCSRPVVQALSDGRCQR